MKKFKVMIIISLVLFVVAGYLYFITDKKTDLKTNIVIEEAKKELSDTEQTFISDTETTSEKIEEKPKDMSSSKTNIVEKKVEDKKSASSKNNSKKTTTPKKEESTKKENSITSGSTSKSDTAPKSEVKEDTKEEKKKTSESVQVIKEEPKKTSIEEDPIYIRMKKELFSSISECNNKGMEVNLKDMDNIASTMCSSESYKGVEVGFRLYIRYNDGTYKEYKK